MRIIAGLARGIQLEVAKGSSTRPFLEMARGALFNSIAQLLPEARLLDLYAGSGALGLEGLSRGARSCTFVERDSQACKSLQNNIARCGFESSATVLRCDAGSAAASLAGQRFGLIFIDPPFPDPARWNQDSGGKALMRACSDLLEADGLAILRLEDAKVATPQWDGLELVRENKYGRSKICRYCTAPGLDTR